MALYQTGLDGFYAKMLDKTGKVLAVGSIGTGSVTLSNLQAWYKYNQGDLEFVLDTDGSATLSNNASGPVSLPAITVLTNPDNPTVAVTPADGKVSVAVTPVADVADQAVSGYNVYVNDETTPRITISTTALTGEIDQLTNGTEYTLYIKAVNPIGESNGVQKTATPATA